MTSPASNPAGARVLVVDDEPDLRTLYELTLLRAGYEVLSAANMAEARDQLAAERFDIVITDLKMEKIDGLRILERTKELYPNTEVIMITGYPTASLEARIRNTPCTQFLTKPFTLTDLIDAIYAAVGSGS